jgi:hypothetical protein
MTPPTSHYERAATEARAQRFTGACLAWACAFAGALEGVFFRHGNGAATGALLSLVVIAAFYYGERSALRAALRRDMQERAEAAEAERRHHAGIARMRAGQPPLDG